MKVALGHNGPVTVAILVPDEGSMAAKLDQTFVGVAVCSPKDLYVEALGDQIATGRAMQEMGAALEDEAVAASVTMAEAIFAEAVDTDKDIAIYGILKPSDFEKVGESLGALNATVFVQFVEPE